VRSLLFVFCSRNPSSDEGTFHSTRRYLFTKRVHSDPWEQATEVARGGTGESVRPQVFRYTSIRVFGCNNTVQYQSSTIHTLVGLQNTLAEMHIIILRISAYVGGWIILGWILERWDGVMWTGLVWLRIGAGGELL
jgi:hypothetical protein